MNKKKLLSRRIVFSVILADSIILGASFVPPLQAQQASKVQKLPRTQSSTESVFPQMTRVTPGQREQIVVAPVLSPADEALAQEQWEFVQTHRVSVVESASQHSVVASDPGTEEDAIASGTHERWLTIVNDPRYIMQQLLRRLPARGPGPAALLKRQQEMAASAGEPWDDGQEALAQQKNRATFPANGKTPTVTPGTPDWMVSLGNGAVAPSMYPAKFDYAYSNPNCLLDYMVYPVNAAGSSGQAALVGMINLYPFCNGGVPTVKFAYYYSTGGTVQTSPEISLDGTKVAFIESRTSGGSIMHVLKLGTTGNNGTSATAPVLPGTGNNASDTAIAMKGARKVTRSSIFVDYNTDNSYAGDDPATMTGNGLLHQFTGTFLGTPTETVTTGCTTGCTSGGWPLLMTGSGILTPPSYDPVSKNVFIGGIQGLEFFARTVVGSKGICYDSGTTAGTPCLGGYSGGASYSYGFGNNQCSYNNGYGGYVDPPLIDIFTGMTFWENGQAISGLCVGTNLCYPDGAPTFFQLSTAFAPASAVGVCAGWGGVNDMHQGSFDNAYFTSRATGHLWISGNDSNSTAGEPDLGYLSFTAAGVISSGTELGAISSGQVDAAPVTSLYDPFNATTWVVAGAPNDSCGGASHGGCIFAYNGTPAVINAGYMPWLPNNLYGNGDEIVDTNGNLQKINSIYDAGASGGTTPTWRTTSGITIDGTPGKSTAIGTVVTNNIPTTGGDTYATGSFAFSTQPPSEFQANPDFPGIWVGGVDWWFEAAVGSTCTGSCPTTDYSLRYGEGISVVLIGDTLAHTIQNLLAAINNSPQTACGYKDPTTTDSGYNTCYQTAGGAQTYATATSSGNTVLLTATVAGTAGNCSGANCYLTYGWISDDTYLGDGDYENFLPASGGLTGGVNGGAAGWVIVNGQTISASVPTGGSQTGTFTGNPIAGNVTISTSLGTETLTASPSTAATAMGGFIGTPTAGQTITITNGANVTTLTAATGTASVTATGSFNLATNSVSYCANANSGIRIGGKTYYLMTDVNSGAVPYCYSCYYDYADNTCFTGTAPQNNSVLVGATAAETAQNLAAAINLAGNAACATTSIGDYGYGAGTCYYQATPAANTYVSALAVGSTVDLTANVAGAAGNCVPGAFPGGCQTGYGWAALTNNAAVTGATPTFNGLSGGVTGVSNACPTLATATYVTNATTTTEATNLAAAINACPATSGVTAIPIGSNVNLTARTVGAGGNSIQLARTAASGFNWTLSTGTPPCNGVASPCNMGGGASGVTSATTFATDGVLAYDATQLAAAINTLPNPATYGVKATSAGAVVTITSNTPGSCAGAGTLASTAAGFAWASGTLPAGSDGTQSATSFQFWGGCAELNAGAIASNIQTAINVNPVLSPIMLVEFANSACASNCTFTIVSNKNGSAYDYPVTTNFGAGTFGWACPAGTAVTAMCGGSNGLIWTYEGPSNGESTVARTYGPSGMIIDSLDYASWVASHAYTLNTRVTDSNGNTQGVVKAGTSGASAPPWCSTADCHTVDGTVTWEYLGISAPANLYLGTLSGPYAQGGDAAMKYTVSGLQ